VVQKASLLLTWLNNVAGTTWGNEKCKCDAFSAPFNTYKSCYRKCYHTFLRGSWREGKWEL